MHPSTARADRGQRTIQSAKFPEEETCKSAQHDRMSCNPAAWGLSKRVRQPSSTRPHGHHFPKKKICIPAHQHSMTGCHASPPQRSSPAPQKLNPHLIQPKNTTAVGLADGTVRIGDTEFLVDMAHVGSYGVPGDTKTLCDFLFRKPFGKQEDHLIFSFGERLHVLQVFFVVGCWFHLDLMVC